MRSAAPDTHARQPRALPRFTLRIRWAAAAWCLWLGLTSSAFADLSLFSTIESEQGDVRSSVQSRTDVRGPWLRRELTGEGILAAYFARTVEIINRTDGRRYRLFPDDQSYTLDSMAAPGCGHAGLVDLRPLGQVQRGIEGTLTSPFMRRKIGAWDAEPVGITVQSTYGVTTNIIFWMCDDLEAVFGATLDSDVWCGGSGGSTDTGALAERVATRFRLSMAADPDYSGDPVRPRVAKDSIFTQRMRGFPVSIESRSGRDSSLSVTTITVDSVRTKTLPDSLFRPPSGYTLRSTGDSGGK